MGLQNLFEELTPLLIKHGESIINSLNKKLTMKNLVQIFTLLLLYFEGHEFAGHPECGKITVGDASGVGHSTGIEAGPTQNPWSVAILVPELDNISFKPTGNDSLQCSGSILTEKFVLTAAHCFFDEIFPLPQEDMTIVVGSEDPTNPPSH